MYWSKSFKTFISNGLKEHFVILLILIFDKKQIESHFDFRVVKVDEIFNSK